MSARGLVLLLTPGADASAVRATLARLGIEGVLLSHEGERAIACASVGDPAILSALAGVRAVLAAPSPHPRVDRAPPVVDIGGVPIGAGAPFVVVAGPCAVESEEQIDGAAAIAARGGARILRGGAFKPRTSPYSYQGSGAVGLEWMRRAARRHGLAMVSECVCEASLDAVAAAADAVQVGSRSMHAYGLLKAVGRVGKPVLLKRGMAATLEEWLLAAEYLLEAGATGVVLCERGIRSFDPATRNVLDLGGVAHLLARAPLPVIVDPSHAAGRRELVPALARAAVAAGAHGVMIEVHPDPGLAKSDAAQALLPPEFLALAAELGALSAWMVGRETRAPACEGART